MTDVSRPLRSQRRMETLATVNLDMLVALVIVVHQHTVKREGKAHLGNNVKTKEGLLGQIATNFAEMGKLPSAYHCTEISSIFWRMPAGGNRKYHDPDQSGSLQRLLS